MSTPLYIGMDEIDSEYGADFIGTLIADWHFPRPIALDFATNEGVINFAWLRCEVEQWEVDALKVRKVLNRRFGPERPELTGPPPPFPRAAKTEPTALFCHTPNGLLVTFPSWWDTSKMMIEFDHHYEEFRPALPEETKVAGATCAFTETPDKLLVRFPPGWTKEAMLQALEGYERQRPIPPLPPFPPR